MSVKQTILILYTTLYRTGGDKFDLAAKTLAREKAKEFPNCTIHLKSIESKREFLNELARVEDNKSQIAELHFIGHSGVYGIMFGTTKWPEQFSPFEWKTMKIPFAPGARAYFHACRTGRWFAPYFARIFGVRTFGHYWYTTISRSPVSFRWEGPTKRDGNDLYVISVPGKKSHGLVGSAFKYSGFAKAIPMHEFNPTDEQIDTSYDSVADLYDETFEDIGVRRNEWEWFIQNMQPNYSTKLLDIGCGNAAFLSKLAPIIGAGSGVDISAGMIEQAKQRCATHTNLSFSKIDGPSLPFADDTFDVVTSMLSFRYLDWDPIIHEILRVLKPGGKFLVVDMVAAPIKMTEIPQLLACKGEMYLQRVRQPEYFKSLKKMVTDPRWQTMLKYNPMRSEHEMKWYLESRFPGQKAEVINVGWSSRIIAFNSGPIQVKTVEKLAFP